MLVRRPVLFVCLYLASHMTHATTLDLSLQNQGPFVVGSNTDSTKLNNKLMLSDSASNNQDTMHSPLFSLNKAHQYLGIGSLVLATVAAVLPKPEDEYGIVDIENSWHHRTAVTAAYFGGAAVASGIAFHYKDIRWSKFFKDPDALHAALATLATAAFASTLVLAPEEVHASAGIAGLVSMAVAIKITW
ncbi:MAG: hypothetical protein OEZ43_06450 [Gammaproteobacteria bacterium]|nr:hypothetical protein [Gammaproteobacteria bacterium]